MILLPSRYALIPFIVFSAAFLSAAPPSTKPVEGLREHPPTVYALTNARIVTEPGRIIDRGTVVVRDGAIVAVGAGIPIPKDAKTENLTGKTIYPGLIDAYAESKASLVTGGADHWNSLITPELDLASQYQPDEATNNKLRRQGIVCRLLAPSAGILKGTSIIASTGEGPSERSLLSSKVAHHLRLGIARSRTRSYPTSPMGAVALARQTFLDAQWYDAAWPAYRANPILARPELNNSLAVLSSAMKAGERFIIDGPNELYLLRGDAFAREFSLNAILRGSGQEYQQLDAIRATGRPLIIPIHFPKPPNVDSPEAARAVDLDELLHWDLAPENPSRLEAAGVRFAICTDDLDDLGEFLSHMKQAVARGLNEHAALKALTTTPAELFGISDRFGTIAVGKSASFVVTDGDLFSKSTKIIATWIEGKSYEIEKPPTVDVRGDWEVTLRVDSELTKNTVKFRGKPTKLSGTLLIPRPDKAPEEVKLTKLSLRDRRLTATFPGEPLDRPGVIQFSSVVTETEPQMQMQGNLTWPDGTLASFIAVRTSPYVSTKQDESDAKRDGTETENELNSDDDASANDESSKESNGEDSSDDETRKDNEMAKPALFAVNYPLGAFGVMQSPPHHKNIVFKHATVWTCGPDGILTNATVLVQNGLIVAVGDDLSIPEDAEVVDATGKHLTPGIIDCHSHMATDGGINEGSQAITAEVRISDFINSNDGDIYRQLAGGVTTANILHGSANPIGGQNQVIKLRWGEIYHALSFVGAPPGIKFALGENVKRSSMEEDPTERYPKSRMGVEQIIRDAFQAAREYQAAWKQWERDHDSLPPRKDLELEALSEVLRGERWVHCHSYRQDEILAMLRTCEDYGIRIATLQHILEGYKVADALARHGAMGSSFSDWWAYKMEVYDAIPYNGALMHHAGVVVSFNSDDRELARHLNHEAAKAIRYGNIEPQEALKFVTLNPAKQLRIDQYVGSIEPGKQADLVLWSGSPLSLLSRCEQTWIDGKKYFDLQEDARLQQEAKSKHAALVQRVLTSEKKAKPSPPREKPDEELWPQEDIYCRARNLR